MIETIDLLWINLVAFLLYIPVICYLDIRYREVNPLHWIPLVLVASPILIYALVSELIPWYSPVISGVMILIFYLAMHLGYLEGADYLFLCLISIFWVVNPTPYPHGLMQIVFYIYFLFVSAMTAVVVLIYNIIKGNNWGPVDMMSRYPRGVPYLVPISIAFLMSVMYG